ncbi:WD40 repeat-like protein [Boletus edulis]|nr:WD40 repeat-like protein [Boletus edulis]
MPGFSVVRSKTSPMIGVGRKLKEKRRIKRVRRGTLDVDTDVDYGALDPLDGEEGELVGCTCSGWGDGACMCGYGYPDVYHYGHGDTQEPESTAGVSKIPTPLTRLPPELFLQVLSYLPLRSILAVSSTCKSWRSLALDNGVWWGLWQAREGIPRVPNHAPSQPSDLGHRTQDSFGGFGRRYRGVKDEGIHGLSMPITEHDGEQCDYPSGWAVNFDRANMRLKETARLGDEGTGNGAFIYPCEQRQEEDGQCLDAPSEEGDGNGHQVEEQEAVIPSEPQPISRQAPLMLDWHSLYRGRSILEQRWRDPEGEPRVLRIDGHRDSVYCLDFDSSRIISGSRDRTIKIWCIKTGKCVASFEGHTGSVLCLKFERDWDLGSDGVCRGFMVSGSSDCTVCVWDLVSTPVGHEEYITTADGSRTGKSRDSYAFGDFGPPRKISAEIRKVLRGHSGGVLDLRMDDKWIVSCSKDALMHVYNRKTLTLHTVLRGHEGPVNAVGLENGRVVSASGDGRMMLWDVETGECIRVFEGHEKGLACIEFKDGLILSGSNDCTIKLWRASTGECLHTFAGHTLLVRAFCFDPKTGYIVSTSYDKSVRVWEWHGEAADTGSQRGAEPSCRKTKGVGRLVREFRNLHASHIFDVKFDVGKIVSTSHDQKIVVLDFSYGIEGAELFV